MISKTIKYEDFDGNEVEQTFHFHISKAELAELNYRKDGGSLAEDLATVAKNETGVREVLDIFKYIVEKSVGKKDGKHFVKSQGAFAELFHTDAYSELLFGLLDDADEASKFIAGVLPNSIQKEIEQEMGGRGMKDLSREELLAKLAETNERKKQESAESVEIDK